MFLLEFEIHLYGVMIGIGILCCFAILIFFGKKYKIDPKFMDFIELNGIAAIAVGFLFAAIFQGLYNYIDDPSKGFNLNGGITFIGGLIGGVISFLIGYFLFGRKYKSKLIDAMPYIPCGILIAHAFGRLGCYFGECCYGKETTSWIGVYLPSRNITVVPTHLFEACFLFIMFGVIFYLAYRKKWIQTLSLYLISYGIWRFVLEYIRGDYRGSFVAGLTPSQFWSIVMVLSSIPVYFLLNYLKKLREKELKEWKKLEE